MIKTLKIQLRNLESFGKGEGDLQIPLRYVDVESNTNILNSVDNYSLLSRVNLGNDGLQ